MHTNTNDLIADYPVCCSKSKVATEYGKRFEIQTNEDFTKLRIDDCIVTSKTIEKCDFGFVRHSNNDFYFIELKGSDIEKALDQIVTTISFFNTNMILIPKNSRLGFIVSSKVPSAGTDVKKLKQIFAKHYGKVLEVKNRVLIYKP